MLYILILAAVQGLTEFLPVSSSGHLEFFGHIPGMEESSGSLSAMPQTFLNLALHMGTLLSVVIYYRLDLWNLTKGLFAFIKSPRLEHAMPEVLSGEVHERESPLDLDKTDSIWFIGYLGLATAMMFPVLLIKDDLDAWLRPDPQTPVYLAALGIIFIINGVMLNSSYLAFQNRRQSKGVDITRALIVGFAQIFAVLPGLSRSGTTITTALWLGIGRGAAVKFSLLLSIPAILGGFLILLGDIDWSTVAFSQVALPMFLGIFVAFVVGYLSIHFLVRLVERMRLYLFGIYTAILGIICLILSWI